MLKKFLPFTFALALCGLTLVGCEEDPVSGDEPSMKAEVDGDDWETSSVDAVNSGGSIVITAPATDGSAILLTIPSDATVESHDLDGLTGYIAAYRPNAQTSMTATAGEITITTINDTEVAGTFEFDATDGTTTVDVDNGSFYVKRN